MKRILIALAVSIILAPALMAGTVTPVGNSIIGGYAGYGYYQTGSGGEFTFKPSSDLGWILNAGYVDTVTQNVQGSSGTFQTFCVEEHEYIWPNPNFVEATFSDHTIFSNVYLTKGAAWLYHQFQIGTLEGYDYTNRTPAIVQELQTAIWYFMGQILVDPVNQFTILGNAHGGLALNNGHIPVAVMNLWVPGEVGKSEGARQDMLVCVPDGGLTVMLLGIGVGGIALVSRKLRK